MAILLHTIIMKQRWFLENRYRRLEVLDVIISCVFMLKTTSD